MTFEAKKIQNMVESSSFVERNLRDEPDADALGVVASLPLTNCHGTVFTVDIQLNSQTLTVALDTSVSGLWLVNSKDSNASAANQTSLSNVTLSFDMVDYVSYMFIRLQCVLFIHLFEDLTFCFFFKMIYCKN